jgi:glycosyltransferase involved in cell wall biosynthesis
VKRRLRLEVERFVRPPDISIAHWFRPPPYGGANQFLWALRAELERRGLRVGEHVIAPRTRGCLLNAFAFDAEAVRRMRHAGCRIVHRVDGPIALYRGFDNGDDEQVVRLNAELADATIIQSHYSLEASRRAGLTLKDPVVIPNAVDPQIFHPPGRRPPVAGRRIRLIASSWSDNLNKGAAALALLAPALDPSRFELTFVGRSPIALPGIRTVPPLPSHALAELLREHDAYICAARNEPCSNALLEALACGLPIVYADSGSNGELVGAAGIPFREDEELPAAVATLAGELDGLRARISIPRLDEVAGRYLEVMGVHAP